MRKIKYRKIAVSFAVMLFLGFPKLNAQQMTMEEKLNTQRIAFFTERLNLNASESKVFWPLYNDYINRKDKLTNESRNQCRYIYRNFENTSDQEISEALKKYILTQDKEHELFLEYNKKFLKILPEKKVMLLYITEEQFKQHLLREIRGRGPGQGAGPGRGRMEGRLEEGKR